MELMKTLTGKQVRFIHEYTKDFNGCQAAIRAGYSKKSARAEASRLLTNVSVLQEIADILEQYSMQSPEVLKRLTEWGRASIRPFLKIESGHVLIDLSSQEAQENIHLLKKSKQTVKVLKSENKAEIIEVTTEIELHNSMDAVVQLGKILGLFQKRLLHSGTITLDDGLDDLSDAELQEIIRKSSNS